MPEAWFVIIPDGAAYPPSEEILVCNPPECLTNELSRIDGLAR